MTETKDQLIENVLALPALDRAHLLDALISSLDRPDPQIDALWVAEANDRIRAFEAGEMEALPEDEVYAEFDAK